jgi:hypothetical protein
MRKPIASALLLIALGVTACELLVGSDSYELRASPDAAPAAEAGSSDGAAADGELMYAIGALEVLATGQAGPRGLALDDTSVYWANNADGTIATAPKTGGGARGIAHGATSPRWVTVDATQIFWSSDTRGGCVGGIFKMLKSASDAGVWVAGCTDVLGRVNGMGMDGTFVYWTTHPSATALFAVPKEGGQVVQLAGNLGGQPDIMTLTPSAIYWINPPLETVSRYDKGTQAVTTMAAGHKGLSAIAADAESVYFATSANVYRLPESANVEAGGAPELIAGGQDGPIAIASIGPHVSWLNAGPGTVVRKRVGIADAAVETLATGQGGVRSLAVDASGVYFSRDTGEVARLPLSR